MQVILRSAQKPTDYDTVAVALCTLFRERKPFRYGDTPPHKPLLQQPGDAIFDV